MAFLNMDLKTAMLQEKPLQMVGAINAYAALLAERVGFKALYVSGAGVANASWAMPDLGITTLTDVLEDVRRITFATKLPLLVDIDTGWGTAFHIARAVKELERAGAAGVHIEDQILAKRCGHRPNKSLVSDIEMVNRIKAAVDARQNPHFVIMARTDAVAKEGIKNAIERAKLYVEAGADMIFPEALNQLETYQQFAKAVKVPILANLTEFGKTPLFTVQELAQVGVAIALYPLSAFRAMSQAALETYQTIKRMGTQKSILQSMQTREDLYKTIRYEEYEKKLDALLKEDTS